MVWVHVGDHWMGFEYLCGAGYAHEELRQHSRAAGGEERQGTTGVTGRARPCHGPKGASVSQRVFVGDRRRF